MSVSELVVRYNALTVSSIASFAGIAGRVNGSCKDVYFLRCVGCNESYLADIAAMDSLLRERQSQGQGAYLRLAALPQLSAPEDIARISRIYEDWQQQPQEVPALTNLPTEILGAALGKNLCKLRELFRSHTPGATESMEKNFISKLLFWLERGLEPLLRHWSPGMVAKFVYTGPVKKSEYLFCYLLTLLGMDVLLLAPSGPLNLEGTLLELSGVVHLGAVDAVTIPPYHPDAQSVPPARESRIDVRPSEQGSPAVAAPSPARPTVTVPPRPTVTVPPRNRPGATPPLPAVSTQRRELAFEQLALLASAVVMIEVHDAKGQSISSGSGIMVGAEGYILTNHHVACKGASYSVHIEDDDTVYRSDEIIKTHGLLDLALIRIPRTLRPIPVYSQSQPLVRGQRVVAIGSPLGLFNSVSDGIISGFRTIDEVDMIQFTAPTSPGSSGGAVLNLYGEVIGISTAGIDRGQNLNLAVGYQSILPFIRGFVK